MAQSLEAVPQRRSPAKVYSITSADADAFLQIRRQLGVGAERWVPDRIPLQVGTAPSSARMPRYTVTQHREIAAPAAAVWDVISAPGHLEECHPFCAANQVEIWPGVGSVDTLEYYSGRTITRRFVAWYDGTGFDIEITDAGGLVAEVAWRLSERRSSDRGNSSDLTIAIEPRFSIGVPTWLDRPAQLLFLRPMLVRYLRAVLAGIDWRVTTGSPVQRNQFGAHRWFSPAVPIGS